MNQAQYVNMDFIQWWRWVTLYPESWACLRHLLPPLRFDHQHTLVRPHGIQLRGVIFSREDLLICRQCGGPVTMAQWTARTHVC